MKTWLREGLEGRTFKATFFLYLAGVLILAPVAGVIGLLFGIRTALYTTPLFVFLMVGVQYGLCYLPGSGRDVRRASPPPQRVFSEVTSYQEHLVGMSTESFLPPMSVPYPRLTGRSQWAVQAGKVFGASASLPIVVTRDRCTTRPHGVRTTQYRSLMSVLSPWNGLYR